MCTVQRCPHLAFPEVKRNVYKFCAERPEATKLYALDTIGDVNNRPPQYEPDLSWSYPLLENLRNAMRDGKTTQGDLGTG